MKIFVKKYFCSLKIGAYYERTQWKLKSHTVPECFRETAGKFEHKLIEEAADYILYLSEIYAERFVWRSTLILGFILRMYGGKKSKVLRVIVLEAKITFSVLY